MRYPEAVGEIVQINGPDQHYAFCTAFLGQPPEHRVSTDGLCRNELLDRAGGYQVLGIVHAAGKALMTLGPNLVLRPTPEYSRMTLVGVEEPYLWRFDEHSLFDQVDDICTGERLRLVAAIRPEGMWGVSFSDMPSVPREQCQRTPPFVAETLEAALWGAVRVFRRGAQQSEAEPVPPGPSRETRLEARLRCLLAGSGMLAESAELDDGKHVIVKAARLNALRGAARRTRQDLESGTI